MDAFAKKNLINTKLLKIFQVRGWRWGVLTHVVSHNGKNIEVKRNVRIPMGRVEMIQATNGLEAGKAYARGHGLVDADWMASASPKVVIRCSGLTERAP